MYLAVTIREERKSMNRKIDVYYISSLCDGMDGDEE